MGFWDFGMRGGGGVMVWIWGIWRWGLGDSRGSEEKWEG